MIDIRRVRADLDGVKSAMARRHDPQLLTELEIPASARAKLVAKMPPTTPEVRVARDIARFLAPAVATKHGPSNTSPTFRPSRSKPLSIFRTWSRGLSF